MTPEVLRRKILRLREAQPVTEDLERLLKRLHPSGRRAWYRSQKEHWLGWLHEYDGPGFYGRGDWDRSAAFVYNHINCAPMALWLAEALGVSKTLLRAASSLALGAGPGPGSRSAAVRRILPTDRVGAAAHAVIVAKCSTGLSLPIGVSLAARV